MPDLWQNQYLCAAQFWDPESPLGTPSPLLGLGVPSGAVFVNSPKEALEAAKRSPGSDKIFIIGGGMIYSAMLPFTDELNLTLVEEGTQTDADVYFPDYSGFTKVISEEKKEAGELVYTYTTLRR